MSANRGDMEASGAQRQRGWLRRNWLWFLPVLLIALVLVVGGVAYWLLFARVFALDVYQSAMAAIQKDAAVRAELGEPIKTVSWPPPSARIEADEKDLWWEVEGPKGRAKAHVRASLMQGKWEIRQLEATLPGGNRRPISEAGGEGEAPKFEAVKPGAAKQESDTPAPQINLPLPPDMGPGK